MAQSQRRGKHIESRTIPAIDADTYLVDLGDVLTVSSFSLAAYRKSLPTVRSEITFLRVEDKKEVPDKNLLIKSKKLVAWMDKMRGKPMWIAVDFRLEVKDKTLFEDRSDEYLLKLSRRIISNNGGGLVIIPGDKKKLSKVLQYILNQDLGVELLEENSKWGYLIFDIPFKGD